MATSTHNFTTNVSSMNIGKPSFLSNHLETLCPATQEDDDWMEQQLEKARAERGGFYKRLTNSRTQSTRDIDGSAEKRRAAAGGGSSGGKDVSISSTVSSSTPATVAIPEPHSSWRFYTSFDNGEWKRHCVPVYKPEDEVIGKIAKSAETVREEKEKSQTSPAYESHLKKYREARANLFDHAPTPRTRISESMPREQTTTVRVTGAGLHDDMGLHNGMRGGSGGAGFGYPGVGGGEAQNIQMMLNYGAGADLLNGGLPVLYPKQNYREETSTKEVITTVTGGGNEGTGNTKQLMSAGASPGAVAGQEQGTRRRSHNLGYQEKIIIPTKYKSEEERMAIEASIAESSSRLASEQSMAEKLKQKAVAESNAEHPSFMGSTFEKFRSDGVPLIKPSFEDPSLSPSSAVTFNSRQSSMREMEREQPPQLPRIIPVFDEPSSMFGKPNISVNRSSFESFPSAPAQTFERTIVESRTSGSSPFSSSVPIASHDNRETREIAVKSSTPAIKPVFGELSTVSQKITMKETMPDIDRPNLSTGIVRSEDSKVEAHFGNNFAPFHMPTAASIGGAGADFGNFPALTHPSENSRTIIVNSGGGSFASEPFSVVPAMGASVDNSVVFIPVIRITGTPSRQQHTSEITINVNEGATPATISEGMPGDISGQFENVLKLHEDKRWIDSEIAKHTPERSTQDIFVSSPVRNTSVNIQHSEQSPSSMQSLFSTNSDSGLKPSDRRVNESETVHREKVIFPSTVGNTATSREIHVSRNFGGSEHGDASLPSVQTETTRSVTSELHSVPGKTIEIDRRSQDGNNSENVRYITATSSSVAPTERIIEPRRSVEIKSVVSTGSNSQQPSAIRDPGSVRPSSVGTKRTVVEVDDWIVEKAV